MVKKVIIVGSGIAGIASALRLRHKGYEVDVFEANSYVGGKLHVYEDSGYRWDAGPSLFTMPFLVDELFSLYNLDPKDHFNYTRQASLCNYFWEDGTRFNAPSCQDQFSDDASKVFGERREVVRQYLDRSKEKYDITAGVFLERSLHKVKNYFNWQTLKSLVLSYKLNVFRSLNDYNRSQFSNPKMVQLFNRFATYNGSSPYKTPGIMSLIPHMESFYGCFFPKGGMHQINKSLYQLALDQGIRFHLSEPVKEIIHDGKDVKGVRTAKGIYMSDFVVSNMDVVSTYRHLLKNVKAPERTLRQERSSSALIFYWGVRNQFKAMDLHNIFFSEKYQEEFDAIFNKKTITNDPTVYVNITSKAQAEDAPNGCENWFVMINVPGDFGQDWDTLKAKARSAIVDKLSRMLDTQLEDYIEVERTLDPVEIQQRTSSLRGSLYGTSSNSRFSAFLRHPNFSSRLNGLYFCGGSVHPGGGIPLCLYSAKIVSDLIPAA